MVVIGQKLSRESHFDEGLRHILDWTRIRAATVFVHLARITRQALTTRILFFPSLLYIIQRAVMIESIAWLEILWKWTPLSCANQEQPEMTNTISKFYRCYKCCVKTTQNTLFCYKKRHFPESEGRTRTMEVVTTRITRHEHDSFTKQHNYRLRVKRWLLQNMSIMP